MFSKYVEWKIFNFFIENPSSFYVNHIARRLKVGAGSVSNFVNKAAKEGLLVKKVVGNIHLYQLNCDIAFIRQFKILNLLLRIEKINLINDLLKSDDSIISIVLYGSYAEGTNDEKSDIDIIAISDKKINFQNVLQIAEGRLKKNINAEVFSLSEWKKSSTENKVFYESVKKSNIVLYGSGLL